MTHDYTQHETLLYTEEHKACINYSTKHNALAHLLDIPNGHYRQYEIDHFMIVFLKKGQVSIDLKGRDINVANQGDFFLLSPGTIINAQAESETSALVCRFIQDFELCESYSFEHLYKIAQNMDNNEGVLSMNKALNYFVQGFEHCVKDGLRCTRYMKIKIMEMAYILRAYYSKEELAELLGPVLTDDIAFKSTVLNNWKRAATVDELAGINNMSPASFRRKFKEVIGDSPHKWIVSKKAGAIKEELLLTDKNLYQIADEFGFDSHNSLIRFCKNYLGNTPTKIRKKD